MYEDLLSANEQINLEDLHDNAAVIRLMDGFNALTEALATSSRTNALWIQYIQLVNLLNSSIVAERTGTLDSYVLCIIV